jgi:two-component system, cell cycle response regulator DivK
MSGELILIVEDNEKNLKLVRDLLRFKGYQTLEAATAAEGIRLAKQHQPHLILMDIGLPDMDGVAALGRIRALPALAETPVVALTAYAMADDAARFLALGFDGYLAKPISVRDFPDQVQSFIARGRHPVELARRTEGR